MTKEQIYREQMTALGTYDPAFDPEIKTLAQLERRLTRAQKAWSETAAAGEKPSFEHPLYAVIRELERDILTHRDTLGLTPKGLRRVRGAYFETQRIGAQEEATREGAQEEATREGGQNEEAANVLDFVRAKYGT